MDVGMFVRVTSLVMEIASRAASTIGEVPQSPDPISRSGDDFGSIMLEENVVSAAGAPHRFTYKTIQEAIKEAGFEPQLRTQQYEWRELPANIQEQIVNY